MRYMIRWLRTLVTFAAVSVIASLLTVGTTALVVDQYLQTTIRQFQLPIDKEPLTAASLWGSLWHGGTSKQPADKALDRVGEKETAQQGGNSYGSHRDNSSESSRNNSNSTGQSGPNSEEALPVWGGNVQEESSGAGDRVLVTPEAMAESKDKLTDQAKEQLFSTLMKKLPSDDWQRISALMEEGLTASELTELEQILAKHLSDDEYKQMRDILTGSNKDSQPKDSTRNNSQLPDQTTSPSQTQTPIQTPSPDRSTPPSSSIEASGTS